MTYPKRLIEVDLPIKKISAHARREKSIRHGHISTLHIWWARRPLAACRAVICAALWPDPVDELCPQTFRDAAATILADFAEQVRRDAHLAGLVKDHWTRWSRTNAATFPHSPSPSKGEGRGGGEIPSVLYADMREALLDFIADFANWDASTVPAFLNAARALTQAAHESLGGLPGTRPLVVDPFAGGGAIPLEALRVGADAFASDLNPVAVLLNKVVLEYIPKYGQRLADEVRQWGQWIKDEAEKELAEFYPKDPDGATPIAYLWARTIISEAPDDGAGLPVEVPLMRSLWLAKKSNRSVALRWVRDEQRRVKTETVEITYANGLDGLTRTVRRPLLEIFEPKKASEVEGGTVARGSATCPVTGYTTPVASVRRQLKARRGGAADARLFAVVTTRPGQQGRFYRLPTSADLEAIQKAVAELERRKQMWQGPLALVPDEPTPMGGGSGAGRAFSQRNYGMDKFEDLFTPRQSLALTTLAQLVREINTEEGIGNDEFALVIQTCLALALDKQADSNSSLCAWRSGSEDIGHTFGRQALPMMWDFVEGNVLSGSTRDWLNAVEGGLKAIGSLDDDIDSGRAERASAMSHPLPDNAVQAFITDPPYYDAVPYADLSDFFIVWLKRTVGDSYPDLFAGQLAPKGDECIVDEIKGKDKAYFEMTMGQAMAEGWRILAPDGVGVVVFAHKSTGGWEAQLQAMVDAGWVITGSWPIDTEMGTRLRAMDSAALASSVHLICRPREDKTIGDWRDVLQELPPRIHAWLPHLAQEGVVGADAIFACLGPALEIFSRYSRVEKASGKQVTLREYLEHVWAAIAKEALTTIFEGADATGFEADARLTAIWFWTLKAAANGNGQETAEPAEAAKLPNEDTSGKKKVTGYSMEYDAVRKLAQGLGAELDKLSRPGGIVTIRGNLATLNGIASREKYLIGHQLSLFNDKLPTRPGGTGKNRTASVTLESVSSRRPSLFAEEENEFERNPAQPFLPSFQPSEEIRPLVDRLMEGGMTTLDRLHQAMLLFGRSQTSLLGLFLRETRMGTNPRFWQLAQALSALYPSSSDEKRWVDGVLARKKGLGF